MPAIKNVIITFYFLTENILNEDWAQVETHIKNVLASNPRHTWKLFLTILDSDAKNLRFYIKFTDNSLNIRNLALNNWFNTDTLTFNVSAVNGSTFYQTLINNCKHPSSKLLTSRDINFLTDQTLPVPQVVLDAINLFILKELTNTQSQALAPAQFEAEPQDVEVEPQEEELGINENNAAAKLTTFLENEYPGSGQTLYDYAPDQVNFFEEFLDTIFNLGPKRARIKFLGEELEQFLYVARHKMQDHRRSQQRKEEQQQRDNTN